MSDTDDGMSSLVKPNSERKTSNLSTHNVNSPLQVSTPFGRKSSDSGGSSIEYDPTDTVPHVATAFDNSLTGDAFKMNVIILLQKLGDTQWRSVPIEFASRIVVRKIYGALTNAIYQITLPDDIDQCDDHNGLLPQAAPKLLMRIYGAHVEHLIDRTHELVMLKRLSKHNIGPRLLGTFTNGRFEQWLDSHTLSHLDMRDPLLSSSIAQQMRELHDDVLLTYTERSSPPTVWTSIDKWLPRAREVIARRRRKEIGRLSDKNFPPFTNFKEPKTDDLYKDDLMLGREWTMFEIALGQYRLYMEKHYHPEIVKDGLALCHNDVRCPISLWVDCIGSVWEYPSNRKSRRTCVTQ